MAFLLLAGACDSRTGGAQGSSSASTSTSTIQFINESGMAVQVAVWPASEPFEFGGGGIRAELAVVDGCLVLRNEGATRRVAVPSTMRLAKSGSGVVVEPLTPSPLLSTVGLGETRSFGVMDIAPVAVKTRERLVATAGHCGPLDALWYWSGSALKD